MAAAHAFSPPPITHKPALSAWFQHCGVARTVGDSPARGRRDCQKSKITGWKQRSPWLQTADEWQGRLCAAEQLGTSGHDTGMGWGETAWQALLAYRYRPPRPHATSLLSLLVSSRDYGGLSEQLTVRRRDLSPDLSHQTPCFHPRGSLHSRG